MRKMLQSYAAHLEQNPNSFIKGVLGLYRIKLRRNRHKLYFIAMKNIYSKPGGGGGSRGRGGDLLFDLKGSTVGRAKSATSRVLKDLDLIEVVNGRGNAGNNMPPLTSSLDFRHYNQYLQQTAALLEMDGKSKGLLLGVLEQDVMFLSRFGLMDYSLLVQMYVSSCS